uniref:DUF1768 domain-containing protein n=1 Tax=Rhabditophanes sp. KR3021 TaxID=114890 RepID=A0AC35TUW7_9BILA
MYKKAMIFNDKESASNILFEIVPRELKKLGRKVVDFDQSIWNEKSFLYMKMGLKAKFSQNRALQRILLTTEDAIIVECAPNDLIWGIGYGMKDPKRFDRMKWKGQDLLGKALMEVREELRRKDAK